MFADGLLVVVEPGRGAVVDVDGRGAVVVDVAGRGAAVVVCFDTVVAGRVVAERDGVCPTEEASRPRADTSILTSPKLITAKAG